MTRLARMRKPCCSRWAMILPAFPPPNASGLIIVNVKLPAISRSCSGSNQFANDVAAREEADQSSIAHDGHTCDVLVDHQRCYLRHRLLGSDAQHLPGHHVAHLLLGGVKR